MTNRNIIKIQEVVGQTKLSRATIYRKISLNEFPKPIKLSERSSGWLEQEVIDYIDACIAERE